MSDERNLGVPQPDDDLDERVRIAERPHAGPPDDERIDDDTTADDAGDDSASGEPG